MLSTGRGETAADEPLLLRVAHVAHLLSVSRSAVYGLIAAGQLPHIRLGGSLRIPRVALERWIEVQTIEPTSERARSPSSSTLPPQSIPLRRPAAQTSTGRNGNRPPPNIHPEEPRALLPSERRPWRVFVDEEIAAQLRTDAETLDVLQRLDDARVAHLGVGSVHSTPVHARGICWNLRTAYEESAGLYGGPGALHFDTWYPDIVALSNPDLASALRADNPWFLLVDGPSLGLEIADWRADFLKEGTSPFPDRVAVRQALRRRERRRARRARQHPP